MKAIVEVAKPGSPIRAARQQLVAARNGRSPDFYLSFESARTLFSELTPARLDLLDTLRRVGPCSVYGLAKAAERNYSNVHTDVGRLEELGLVERTEAGEVSVPFEAVEILVPLAQDAAAPGEPRKPNAEDPFERLKGSGKRGTHTDKIMRATRGDD